MKLLTYLLTYSLHDSGYYLRSWLSLRFVKNIELSLWNAKVHYCVHKSPPLVPILSQMHPTVFTWDLLHLKLCHEISLNIKWWHECHVGLLKALSHFRDSDPRLGPRCASRQTSASWIMRPVFWSIWLLFAMNLSGLGAKQRVPLEPTQRKTGNWNLNLIVPLP
jgi:hypothetical protein